MIKRIKNKIIRLINEKNVNLGHNVYIRGILKSDHPDHVYIDDNSFINIDCHFYFGDQLSQDTKREIGKNVFLAPRVFITTGTHTISNKTQRASSRTVCKSVKIGDGSWIGANVTILPGVEIGSGVVVAAGSVVTKDIPNNTLYAGVPAVFKRKLD